jgi:two-component system, NtrC family, sensor kinase
MKILNRLSLYRSSFRFRLYFIFTVTIALLTAAFASFYVVTDIKGYRSNLEREGVLLATILAQNARLPLFAENREALAQLGAATARYPSILFVSICNKDGRLLTEIGKEDNHRDDIEITVAVTSPGRVLSPDVVLLGNPQVDEQRVIGRVHMHLDTSGAHVRLRKMVAASLAIGTLFWVVVSLLSYQIIKRLTFSFNCLLGGIEEIGSGNLSARVELHGTDELGRAANAINSMAASLELRELENLSLQEELLQAMKLEVQDEKKRVMARLIHTNKMTSLGLLLSSMAHEINNPNASIRFSGHMIAKMWADVVPILDGFRREEGEFYLGGVPFETARGALTENAAHIVENSERIARVIQGLKEYGVGDGSGARPCMELNGVVSAALSVLACQMKQNVLLKTSLADDLPAVSGNQQQMEQVFINLILNAMQALPDGRGEVLLSTSYDAVSSLVVFEVQDNGTGIDAEIMDRLFEPFFSTKLERGGSGLGLYISQYIVKEHGGSLQLSSVPGQGTLARVLLPTRVATGLTTGLIAAQNGEHAPDPAHQVG